MIRTWIINKILEQSLESLFSSMYKSFVAPLSLINLKSGTHYRSITYLNRHQMYIDSTTMKVLPLHTKLYDCDIIAVFGDYVAVRASYSEVYQAKTNAKYIDLPDSTYHMCISDILLVE